MQKFQGKICKLHDALTGFESFSKEVISEEVFVSTLKDHEWIYLRDENKNVLGYFDKFWIDTIDGVKYVMASGFIYDNVDFDKVKMLNGFEKIESKKSEEQRIVYEVICSNSKEHFEGDGF